VLEPQVTVGPLSRRSSQVACATIPAGPELLAVVRSTIENDSLGGFGGVDINVAIHAAAPGGAATDAVDLGKAVRFSPRLPAERVANTNPILTEVAAQIDRGNGVEEPAVVPSGACTTPEFGLKVPSGADVKFAPRPLDGSAETYVVPTFEGGSRTFTENLRYQWLATAGSFSRGETGGPRDRRRQPAGDLEHVVGTRGRRGQRAAAGRPVGDPARRARRRVVAAGVRRRRAAVAASPVATRGARARSRSGAAARLPGGWSPSPPRSRRSRDRASPQDARRPMRRLVRVRTGARR
jgi:hypothetical protein